MTDSAPSPNDATATAENLLATAYHEAGHAVIAMALGRAIHRVSVVPNQSRLGQCELQKGSRRVAKDAMETQALILLAGMVAEQKFTQRRCVDGARSDLRQVETLIDLRAATEKQMEKIFRRLLDKVEYLIEQEENWLAIQFIAAELVKSPTLSGRAAEHWYRTAIAKVEKG